MDFSGNTALILEDNETGRFVLRAILEHYGFTVVESATAPGAIEISNQHQGAIHLLIADVVLRTVGGMEVVRELKRQRPDMALLFVSGYPLEQLLNRGLIEPGFFTATGATFLQKPFAASTLMQAIEKLLGGPVTDEPSQSPGSGE